MSQVVDSSITGEIIQTASQNTNVFLKYWEKIDWGGIVAKGIDISIQILIFTALYFFIKKVGVRMIHRSFEKYRKKETVSASRIDTLTSLSLNVFHYTIVFIYVYILLSIFGIPVGTLIAGAGVVGLALAFGAQGFVSDIVTGLFIMLEKQIDVGDYVMIAGVEGNIEAVGLRTTQVRSGNGTLNFIPNRNITVVSNQSRGYMRALIDVRVTPDADLDKIRSIIEEINQQFVKNHPEIVDGPTFLGLQDLGNGALAVRVVAHTQNGSQSSIQRLLLKEYIDALTAANITIPASPLNLGKI
ncbi:mechanosensitive ion channel family protein [Isobaculum melis]|uniref:Small conductance mechanosensitive channel n=1 Tax=Isobaculum melis TaxID=142588 RepID=A0A1H9RIZ3_9LACT|nr:mechanosensitive ion channel family protein [Isobaculum melis]SER72760.1 small conductance mechanosensitive channel [Isobaculum melis]